MNRNYLSKLSKKLSEKGDKKSSDVVVSILRNNGGQDPLSNLTYSFIVRELRLKGEEDIAKQFQEKFKKAFDEAFLEELENPEEIALMEAMNKVKFDYGSL